MWLALQRNDWLPALKKACHVVKKNAVTSEVVHDGLGITGITGGIPFPFPQSGLEAIWNVGNAGRMYSERLGKWHFWLTMIGFNITFMSQFFLGVAGMPRRIPDYALQFAPLNMVSSLGAFLLGASQLLLVYNIARAAAGYGKPATNEVWDGAQGLEFTLPSPPPHHTFEEQPVVT